MQCFGREKEAKELWARFDSGQNLLMLAPRRIGKTRLMNHLVDTAGQQGYRALLLNLEGLQDEKEFFRECCSAIQEELSTGKKVMTALSQRLSQLLVGNTGSNGDWRSALVQADWQDFANHLFAHLDAKEDGGKPWLLLVDELPVFVQALQAKFGDESLKRFLYWLRNMRQKHTNVRWLYAGSIGLDAVARRSNVEGALNDLHPYTLQPFSPKIATEFLHSIAQKRGTRFSEEAVLTILSRLGWLSPRYLEVVAEDAIALGEEEHVSQAAASTAMDRLLDLDKRIYWSSWREHIDRNFGEPDRGRLHDILKAVARDATGVDESILLASSSMNISQQELRNLLYVLLNDGFLYQSENGRYTFKMVLLREWWLRYVVL